LSKEVKTSLIFGDHNNRKNQSRYKKIFNLFLVFTSYKFQFSEKNFSWWFCSPWLVFNKKGRRL